MNNQILIDKFPRFLYYYNVNRTPVVSGDLGAIKISAEITEILITKEEIDSKVAELGRMITRDYKGKSLLCVGILKGAFIFLADLIRKLNLPDMSVDFMAVSSYGAATHTSGVVQIIKDLNQSVTGRHVLIVEDIVDSGLTLKYLLENIRSRQPASVKVCTLVDKPARRKVEIEPDYNGFQIDDRFIVGYGLDYNEQFRQLPYIGVLRVKDN